MTISRSLLYVWRDKKETGQLYQPQASGRRGHWRIGLEKVARALRVTKRYKEVASQYLVAVKCDISTTTVGKIWKELLPEMLRKEKPKREPKKHYQWLKKDACWSIDTMYLRFRGYRLYLMILLEEYSRLILGLRLSGRKKALYAWELVERVIKDRSIKPLIIKHDRGSEFLNYEFQGNLSVQGIISLPSPGYYPLFNSRLEGTNRLMRKFTRPLEGRGRIPLDDLYQTLARGERIINEEFPKRIFNGRTSLEIYQEGESYQESERDTLIAHIYRHQEAVDGLFSLRGKELDKRRKEVIELLEAVNLCRVGSIS